MVKEIVLENRTETDEDRYHDTPLTPEETAFAENDPDIPQKIWQMMMLYRYGDGSFEQQKRNFRTQGSFMKDYEDDYRGWCGKCTLYSPSYHDLTVNQLRKYFTWRTDARKGGFRYIETPFAYLYLQELLCGIGCESPEESLNKMAAFEAGFIDSGIGEQVVRKNLKHWMFDFAVINLMPHDTLIRHIDPFILAHDTYLAALKDPETKRDDEIFMALAFFAEKDLFQSPVVTECPEKGKHLFAALWKYISARYSEGGEDFFSACFGEIQTSKWYPLFNALYHDDCAGSDKECTVDECREYFCRDGIWYEKCYEKALFNKERFNVLIHEGERVFRKYLKAGRALRKKADGSWAAEYAEALLSVEKRAEIEAAKPKIEIDLSGLDKIRSDAALTRESLLTEDEIEEETAAETVPENEENGLLDKIHTEILRALLKTGSADGYIKAAHLMPSVVADTINAALFDEIGDNIIECDGKTLAVVEDYVEEVEELLQNPKPC